MTERDEEVFLVSCDRLAPAFRLRVRDSKIENACAACGRQLTTAGQVGLVVVHLGETSGGEMVCSACAPLPHAELARKLEIVEDEETDPAAFVSHAKMAECTLALACGLDPGAVIDWGPNDWDYGLVARFGMVRRPDRAELRAIRLAYLGRIELTDCGALVRCRLRTLVSDHEAAGASDEQSLLANMASWAEDGLRIAVKRFGVDLTHPIWAALLESGDAVMPTIYAEGRLMTIHGNPTDAPTHGGAMRALIEAALSKFGEREIRQ